MEQKKPIRYSQKWARAVTFLSVVGVLLILAAAGGLAWVFRKYGRR